LDQLGFHIVVLKISGDRFLSLTVRLRSGAT
jgi:hypothetical protein